MFEQMCARALVCLCLLNCKFQTCSLNNSVFYVLLPWMSWNWLLGPATTHTHKYTHTNMSMLTDVNTPRIHSKGRGKTGIVNLLPPLHFTLLLLLLKLLLLTSRARVKASLLLHTMDGLWRNVTALLLMEHLSAVLLLLKPADPSLNVKFCNPSCTTNTSWFSACNLRGEKYQETYTQSCV